MCGPGTAWNPSINTCDYAYKVNCNLATGVGQYGGQQIPLQNYQNNPNNQQINQNYPQQVIPNYQQNNPNYVINQQQGNPNYYPQRVYSNNGNNGVLPNNQYRNRNYPNQIQNPGYPSQSSISSINAARNVYGFAK